jgi:lipid II:glycine glycyltransferase (peptidoglycan interpeptide bridge formation enzyme)
VVFGGPLVSGDDPEITSALLAAFYEKIRSKVLFSQFRNLRDTSSLKPLFLASGYEYEDHLDIHINLDGGTEKLWSLLHSTRRKQIGRSIRRGVTVKESSPEDRAVLSRCYEILKATYRREGVPLPALPYFEKASALFGPGGMLKLFTAYFEGEIIGFRMVLCFGKTIYDWYAASISAHNDKYPNDLLPWEILKYGSQNGWELFDFGGAGKPGVPYGVRDYKQKFGGETVNFGRYQKIFRPLFYKVVMFIYKLSKR